MMKWQKVDVVKLCEPAFDGVGKVIRKEIIRQDTGRSYSALTTAMAYALDREVLYKTRVLPALKNGAFVLQDRGLPASLAYQTAQAKVNGEKLSMEDILSFPGNRLALENAPGILIIPDVDVSTAMKRIEERDKKDNSIFENPRFQKSVRAVYFSKKFEKIFSNAGTKIVFVDTGISHNYTKNESINAIREYLRGKKLFC